MRAHEFTTEARRNPHMNPKTNGIQYFLDYVIDEIPLSEWKNYGVSMSSIQKLGIHPRSQWSGTPLGVYFYPLEYFYKMRSGGHSVPYGSDMPFINLIKYDNSHELNLQNTPVDFDKIKSIGFNYYKSKVGDNGRDYEEIVDSITKNASGKTDAVKAYNLIRYITNIASMHYKSAEYYGKQADGAVVSMNKLLRQCGFTSVVDEGAGIIHRMEPTQGVILDPSVILSTKRFENYRQNTDEDAKLINRITKMTYEEWSTLSDSEKAKLFNMIYDLYDTNYQDVDALGRKIQKRNPSHLKSLARLKVKIRDFNERDRVDNLPNI